MKNFVQAGNRMVWVATAAVVSGEPVLVGDMVGVAETSAAIGEETVLVLVGVFDLPKATGAISQGAQLYWDNTAKKFTTTASGNKPAGKAFAGALSADATVPVRLD